MVRPGAAEAALLEEGQGTASSPAPWCWEARMQGPRVEASRGRLTKPVSC